MSIVPWEPWKELEELRRQTDRMWDVFLSKLRASETSGEPIGFVPDVDIVETSQDLRILVSVPGVLEEDIEISVVGNTLIIHGQRESPYDSRRSRLREWRYGFFERRLRLPSDIDKNKIRVGYDAGVLTIVVPKCDSQTEEARP
ncbi:MAG: Hsp20/alpha crystallin family protein [bacterium]|nr:Hsp20/alpha crystallin family protein [bacterium]